MNQHQKKTQPLSLSLRLTHGDYVRETVTGATLLVRED
jgi:hypothetical protein